MESIYSPDIYCASEHINFEEYFKDYSDHLLEFQKSSTDIRETDEYIFKLMGVQDKLSAEQKLSLIKSCSIDLLKVPGENEPTNPVTSANSFKACKITEEAKRLHTVQEFLKRQEKYHEQFMGEQKLPEIDMRLEPNAETSGPPDLAPGRDYVVYIRLFRPFKYVYGETSKSALIFDQEIALLGSNTLAQLRDQIHCATDIKICQDVSEDLENIGPTQYEAQLYPSGFIFIDDTFYNDFRRDDAIDYSEVIRQWATTKRIGPLNTAQMADTHVRDLRPRLGYPYVYQHQKRCEHVFMFAHARLLNHDDNLHAAVYPYFRNTGKTKLVFCMFCGAKHARWLVCQCDRIPKDQALLCTECVRSYCYVDGRKVGTFQVYPYFNKPLIT